MFRIVDISNSISNHSVLWDKDASVKPNNKIVTTMEVSQANKNNSPSTRIVKMLTIFSYLFAQSDGTFSINVSASTGLPPTEIYLYGESENNESILEAETPAHGNLSMKDTAEEATEPKQPRAPKNIKQTSGPRKFTFEGVPSNNSLLESRDEEEPNNETHEKKESITELNRDEMPKNMREILDLHKHGEAFAVTPPHMKTPEEMEHEEGAFWFAECGIPQIDPKNSFPTVPFDEEQEPQGDLNLFCNRPPQTHTPAPVCGTGTPTVDKLDLDPIIESASDSDGSKPKVVEKMISDESPKQKVTPVVLSPASAAVMSRTDLSSFQDEVELAPSDELENRCSVSLSLEDVDMTPAEKDDDKIASSEDKQADTTMGTEEIKEDMAEDSREIVIKDVPRDKGEIHEDKTDAMKIEVPSVENHSNDSNEPVERDSMAELREQLDALKVSEALEAVSHSFQQQAFLGTELCGQHIMEWFGNGKQQ